MHVEWKARRRLSLCLVEAMKDIFARCSKKMAVKVCTNYNPMFIPI
jgi:hypothetical protein